MKKMGFSHILLMIMSINIYSNSLTELIKETTYDGQLRVGYQSHSTSKDRANEFATGVKLHMETGSLYGIQFGTTLITSQGNGKANVEDVPFFDENSENYTSISEVYLKTNFADTTLILGRQILETPFADSDDIGMVPNTFEAFTLVNNSFTDTSIFLSHVKKWSGVDSDAPSRFTDVNGDSGMQILGLTYEGLDHTSLSGWFYHLKDLVQINYLEVNYADGTDAFSYEGTIQYTYQDYENGDTSTIYGAALSLGVKKTGLTSTISYNRTVGIAADNFFGGGPFLTNAEHNTLREAGPDGNTILYTLEWDASVVGVNGLSFVANFDAHHGNIDSANEYDLGIKYAYSDKLNISAIYSDIDDEEESFKNLRVFVNYTF